jgi:hypothetical protein
MKSNDKPKKIKKERYISKRELRELMGIDQPIYERRHGALRRKGR